MPQNSMERRSNPWQTAFSDVLKKVLNNEIIILGTRSTTPAAAFCGEDNDCTRIAFHEANSTARVLGRSILFPTKNAAQHMDTHNTALNQLSIGHSHLVMEPQVSCFIAAAHHSIQPRSFCVHEHLL